MAPEIFKRRGDYTIKVDIYSLGLIFASLINGAGNRSNGLMIAFTHNAEATPLGKIQLQRPELTCQDILPQFHGSQRMEMLVHSMLATNDHSRPSADDIVQNLQEMNSSDCNAGRVQPPVVHKDDIVDAGRVQPPGSS